MNIGYFISGHGLGHATRSVAILQRLLKLNPNTRIFLSSSMPHTLASELAGNIEAFEDSFIEPGIIQSTQFDIDYNATLSGIRSFLDNIDNALSYYAKTFSCLDCIVSDISAIGILLSKKLSTTSILIDNFRWDWIYSELASIHPEFGEFSKQFQDFYDLTDIAFQTEPCCQRDPRSRLVPPIFRSSFTEVNEIKKILEIKGGSTILLSLTDLNLEETKKLLRSFSNEVTWLIPSNEVETLEFDENIRIIPSFFYHPDLVRASDVVVAKLGYSTLAEVYAANRTLAYFSRTWFPESAILEEFAGRNMNSLRLEGSVINQNNIELIHSLLNCSSNLDKPNLVQDGAELVATAIANL